MPRTDSALALLLAGLTALYGRWLYALNFDRRPVQHAVYRFAPVTAVARLR